LSFHGKERTLDEFAQEPLVTKIAKSQQKTEQNPNIDKLN